MVSRTVILLIFLACSSASLLNACNFSVTMKQELNNEGFHRNLTYEVIFNMKDDNERWVYNDCIMGLEQTLPAGVFANPDELGDLRRTKRINAVLKNRINIELPSEQSSPSTVYVIGKLTDGRAYLWLPVHARYHMATAGGGMARNEIGPPVLYVRCAHARLAQCGAPAPTLTLLCNGSSGEKCGWKKLPYTMMTGSLHWDVPVGNTDHYYVTAAGTAIVVVVGSLYLLKAIHEYKLAARKKHC